MHGITIVGELSTSKVIIKIFLFMKQMCHLDLNCETHFGSWERN